MEDTEDASLLEFENSVLRSTLDDIRDMCQQILARDEHDPFAYAQRLVAEDVLARISEGREMMLP